MDDEALWRGEEALWTGGPEAYAALMDPCCVMAFPGAGMLRGKAITDALAGAPRWASVVMRGRAVGRSAPGVAVLGYRAEGRRGGDPPYRASCLSTWRAEGEGWRLVAHAQVPS